MRGGVSSQVKVGNPMRLLTACAALRILPPAIASRTRARAEAVARDWDIPVVYDDLGELLAAPDVDAVVNLTPIAAHYETSLRILAAGKHLVTEKPLASTLAQAGELIEAAA